MLYFYENFKKLRRDADKTQEQMADIFRVSPQAISRWETGSSYPDIELLPVIAEYFGVTLEELLGCDRTRREERLQLYRDRFHDAITNGRVYDCIAVSREAVAEFPNNYEMLNQLMYALFVSGDETGNIPDWRENMEKYKEEIIELGERILAGCTDDNIRLEAKARLGFHYCEIGDKAKGRAIFETLPSLMFTREEYIGWALEGEELERHVRHTIRRHASALAHAIWEYVSDDEGTYLTAKKSPETILEALDIAEKIYRLIFGEDLGYKRINIAVWNLKDRPKAYLALNQPEKALACVLEGAKDMQKLSELPQVCTYTAFLVEGETEDVICDRADTRSFNMRVYEDSLLSDAFAALREMPGFTEACELVKNFRVQ